MAGQIVGFYAQKSSFFLAALKKILGFSEGAQNRRLDSPDRRAIDSNLSALVPEMRVKKMMFVLMFTDGCAA